MLAEIQVNINNLLKMMSLYDLMMYKISQNTELWEEMDKTEERHFVECAPRDRRLEDYANNLNIHDKTL